MPGAANATIRSRASLGRNPGQTGPVSSSTLKALIYWGNLVSSGEAAARPSGLATAERLAPFVYRLGRHPFTVERAVRFR